MLFWIELFGLCALIPAILLSRPRVRENRNGLFAVATMVVAGGILNRLNVNMFGMYSYTGPVYIPSHVRDQRDGGDVHLRRRGVRRGVEVPAGLPG